MKKIFAVYGRVKLIHEPAWLEQFRALFDEPYDFHITLKQSAFIEDGQLEEIKAIMNKLRLPEQKITLTFDDLVLDRYDSEDKYGYIYLFCKIRNEALDELQLLIRQQLMEYSTYCAPSLKSYEYNFSPHITIARNLDSKLFKKAVKELRKDYQCYGEITEVVLSCVNETTATEATNPKNQTFYLI